MEKTVYFATSSLIALSVTGALLATPAMAGKNEDLKAQIEALKKQIADQQAQLEALSAQVQDVKVSAGNQFAESQRQVAESPNLTVKDARPTFASADGKTTISLRGRLSLDYPNYFQDDAGPLATDFRRGSFGTGETRNWNPTKGVFSGLKPAKPLTFDGEGWGALELAVRYSFADLNSREELLPAAGGIRGGEQEAWTVGLNWYVNNNIRFLLDYQFVDVDRAYGAGVFVPAAGAQIGQDLEIVSLRTQFTS